MDMKIIEELYGKEFVAYECTSDAEMRFKDDVPGLSEFLGYEGSRNWEGVSLWDLVLRDEIDIRRCMLLSQVSEGDVEIALPLLCGDGSTGWFLNRGRRFGDSIKGVFVSMGRIKGLFDKQSGKLNSYKERLERTETIISTLQDLSERDSLTKLYNSETTKHLCAEYLMNANETCALIMFDLDGFKQVNDVFGHMEGDLAITRIATEVRRLFRSGDIIGRVGGDEFLVLMKNISAEDIVNKKCEAIVSAVSSIGEEMNCAFLGCSVGAAVTIASNVDFDEMFRLVDAIMYSVKNNGGRNYKVMSEATDK